MPRSRRSPDEYQRAVDADRPEAVGDGIPTPTISGSSPDSGTPQRAIRRERVPKDWTNPYTDGLPDWPELIQNLTQHQRDAILDKLPRAKTR